MSRVSGSRDCITAKTSALCFRLLIRSVLPAEAGNITRNAPVLRLAICCVLPENFSIGQKIHGLLLHHKPGMDRVQRGLYFHGIKVPTTGIFRRIQRQPHEPLQLTGQKFTRLIVG